MKKILKNRLFIFIVTAITFGSIEVFAATTYSANLILYKTTNGDKPLNEVLNELYGKNKNTNPIVSEVNFGSGGARTCHIVYNLSNGSYNSINFSARKGGGVSGTPVIYYSEDGTNFIKIDNIKTGDRYVSVDQSYPILSNYKYIKLEWEIADDRAWLFDISFN